MTANLVASRGPRLVNQDYLLGDVLGSGGMGIVYSALQRSLGRRVAIKLPRPELATDPFVMRRFLAEARAGGQLDHRNIARVIDFGGCDGAPFLVMQLVAGIPLDKMVMNQGPLGNRVASELCGQVLSALGEIHNAGIIHADIKSGNVLVETLSDGTLLARVIDFGLARFTDEPSVHDDRLLSGTPDYLAPELIRGGAPTVASDIYAAGVMLYELLTGTTPFGGGSSAQILGRQLDDVVVPPSLRRPDQDIPDALEAVVMKALAKDPAGRFSSAAKFTSALRAATPAAITPSVRIASGTRKHSVFSAEATTHNWQRSSTGAPLDAPGIPELRTAVTQAVDIGDTDVIVTSYLELVRALIDGRRLTNAAEELETAIAFLRPSLPAETPPALWRLQLCLAAVYSGLGDPVRATLAAKIGQADAVRAESELGQDRASDLLIRLAQSGKPRPSLAHELSAISMKLAS